MILVDTSAWLDFLNERDTAAARHLDTVMERQLPFGIAGIIYQELLQGTASSRDFEELDSYLRTQRFYHLKHPVSSYARAAAIYARCRHMGITPRSTIDCLIVQLALEHDLILLHRDKDFPRIAQVVGELKLYESLTR